MSSFLKYQNEDLAKQILAALVFYDMFDYPLTQLEIWKFLQSTQGGLGSEKTKLEDVVVALAKSPFLEGRIHERHGFYMLMGREDLYEARLSRHNQAQARWRKLWKLINWIGDIPFLEMVAACNMFPIDTPAVDSDVDIVIVARRGRIWLVRLLVTMLIALTGQWRHKKVAGKLCLSFFMTDDNLDLKKLYQDKKVWQEPDPYLINWVAIAAPVYDRHGTAKKFFKANAWIKDYMPNIFPYDGVGLRRTKVGAGARGWQSFWEGAWSGKVGDKIEAFVRWWQVEYMKSRGDQEWMKNPNVIRSDEVLKFHEVDRRHKFSAEFEKRLAEELR